MSVQPEDNPEYKIELSESPQINTEGGSVVHGNISIDDGDFIGRDKNIYIGTLKIPRWLLAIITLAAIIILIILVYISNRSRATANITSAVATRVYEPTATSSPIPTLTPIVMGDDVFGIAIAALNAINVKGETLQSDFASSISDSIASYINEQANELRDVIGQSVEIWGSELVQQTVTEDTASEAANSLNADILVFGTMYQIDESRWRLQPSFYLSEKAVRESVNLGGEYPLGNEILYRADSNSSLRDINTNLRIRLKALSQIFVGVSYIAYDNKDGYQRAAQVLQQAIDDLQPANSDDDVGKEVIYHFLGSAYFLWSTLLNDDSVERLEVLEKARVAYNGALAVNPQFVRAHNGLGSTLFQISRPLAGETNQEDPCNWKWDTFDAAREQYQIALDVDSRHKPPSGYVNFYSHFGLGRIHFYQGVCRNGGNFEVALEDWQKAHEHYKAVLEEYSTINEPLPVLQNVAAYASADLGQIALIQWDHLVQTAESDEKNLSQLLTSSSDYLANAVALDIQSGTEPGQKHAIAAMPNYLTALCMQGKTAQMQLVLDEFLAKLQNSTEIKQSIIAGVLPSWEDCTNG